MAGLTPRFGFYIPDDLEANDIVGLITKLVNDIDEKMARRPAVGDMRISFSTPSHYIDVDEMRADGQSMNKNEYPALFDAIGYTYSGTTGGVFFKLPRAADALLIAAGANHPFGSTGNDRTINNPASGTPTTIIQKHMTVNVYIRVR